MSLHNLTEFAMNYSSSMIPKLPTPMKDHLVCDAVDSLRHLIVAYANLRDIPDAHRIVCIHEGLESLGQLYHRLAIEQTHNQEHTLAGELYEKSNRCYDLRNEGFN